MSYLNDNSVIVIKLLECGKPQLILNFVEMGVGKGNGEFVLVSDWHASRFKTSPHVYGVQLSLRALVSVSLCQDSSHHNPGGHSIREILSTVLWNTTHINTM